MMLRGTHDNWEKLVGAVLGREELRRIAYCESLSSSISADFSSRFSFDSVVPAEASEIPGRTLDLVADSSNHGTRPIRLKEIKKATKNFHSYMWSGQGGFGLVFKGWIDEHTLRASKRGSGTAVAVKKWTQGSMQGYQEYLKEINYLSQLHHPNLVKLIGYCSEEDNLILVYEFTARGSLDNHLFRRGHQSLSWKIRMKVAIGAARALSFLHDLATPVIHRGCQCGNILLDGEFNAKLSDFGLARDGPTDGMTHVSTRVVGLNSIIAPEYAMTGDLTEKSEVYSFGAVLLELLSGCRARDIIQPMKEQYLIEWAKEHVGDKRKMLQIMDTRLDGQYPYNEAYTVMKLACQCLSAVPEERPRMAEVVVALQQLQRL
ncbi:protein kinase 2B [Perilla frutescens var. frutescens]|nr:protein kinase 2B [Perilla frutescens var. frutescens]